MLLKTNNEASRRRMQRAAERELDAKFETLTDPTFLDRASNYRPRKKRTLTDMVRSAGNSVSVKGMARKVRH